MSLWVIRIFFLSLCTLAGFALSDLRPDLIRQPYGPMAGFGLGGLLIALDEMLKGFSLRAFSAASFGLMLGTVVAWMLDQSQLFRAADPDTLWLIRLGTFLGFGYIGIVLAMRINKDDFALIIPYLRFRSTEAALRCSDLADRIASRLLALGGDGREYGTLRWALHDLTLPAVWSANPEGTRSVDACALVFTGRLPWRGRASAFVAMLGLEGLEAPRPANGPAFRMTPV